MIKKLLIANRGEIACRIIKTAQRLGIQTVAIYAVPDQDALHVTSADEAFALEGTSAQDTYLNITKIIQIALESQVCAIHPGYGFLAENPAFAAACQQHGIIWVGPSVHALTVMGSKQLAKQLLANTDVPLTPGYHGDDQTVATLLAASQKIGFPVLLKAASGGGGKGMRIVNREDQFLAQLAGAQREALAYFADDTILIEKLITSAKHIEIQIMADKHGHVVHLFERDCSIQRRHQKIIEEAPAAQLSPELRQQLAHAATAVAQAIHYEGAGTVEFLVRGDHYYFMEMNTRLQVEHPVTEMITGFDLVEWQLLIADNQVLPTTQTNIQCQGHAIEVRIYAEDPSQEFLPSVGQIHFLKEPQGEGIRIDTGMQVGSTITQYYDPMVAKLICHGTDRAMAIRRLRMALSQVHIGGIKTNKPLLTAILQHQDFQTTDYTTDFLQLTDLLLPTPDKTQSAFFAATVDYVLAQENLHALALETLSWQIIGHLKWSLRYRFEQTVYDITLTPHTAHSISLRCASKEVTYDIYHPQPGQLKLDDGTQCHHLWYQNDEAAIHLFTTEGSITAQRFRWQKMQDTHNHQLVAPMPATVVAILKKVGDIVQLGDSLLVLEAMKMEHTIRAPYAGVVREICYELGAQVAESAELILLDAREQVIP